MAAQERSDLGSDPTRISSGAGGHPGQAGEAIASKQPRIPQVIIEGELGRGGMGVVWRGRQEYIDRPVAVKVLTAEHGLDEAFRRRFQREAKILSDFNHPHLVSCYAAGINDDGYCFLVMELIQGPDLNTYLREQGPLSSAQAIELGVAMSAALEHVWSKGVIHRDVKCENILCAISSGMSTAQLPFTPKLADVGLAKPSAQSATSEGMNLTLSGMIVGTPSTMAPEQFDSPEAVDYRADIYALGCVLYQSLTGARAFPQRGLSQLMAAKTTQPDLQHWPQTHSSLRRIIMDCLQPDPQHRPPDYATLRHRLQACRTASHEKGRGLRRRAILLSLLVMILLAALAVALVQQPQASSDSDAEHGHATHGPSSAEEPNSTAPIVASTEEAASQTSHVSLSTDPWPTGILWDEQFLQRLRDWHQPQGGWGAAEEINHARYPLAVDGFAREGQAILLRRQWAATANGVLTLTLSPVPDLAGESFDELRWVLGHSENQIVIRIQHLGSLGLVSIQDHQGDSHGPITLAGDGDADPWVLVCSWQGGDWRLRAGNDKDEVRFSGMSALSALEFQVLHGSVRLHELRYAPDFESSHHATSTIGDEH